ncbi:MAG: exodeoxyribonuclease VII large subunit [Tannerella sp.]|jgi:exodeoxyribonuclease VII large subunit|nr:exodeoxyribonuclease VII large subunit [Tannerella sp.]
MAFEINELSLLELNSLIRDAFDNAFPETYWVRAETSDVRVNASSGHCYLEFIEKDEKTGQTLAKARGAIWSNTFHVLRPYFETETGQAFGSGMKVLVNVSVEFHEIYGYSLNVTDIDPSYTIGDIVRKRKEIILRLQEEGVFTLNKELPFPALPQRIAVITSPTAAGYEDFADQLKNNEYGFSFYVKLFPAVMQGEKTEKSIIEALNRIFSSLEMFDVVVIIRGGGSASELNIFDSYRLAANCAQFPLPVITGIGHERDDTVVDMVANTRLKTPTAVAAFLIEKMYRELAMLQDFEQKIYGKITARLNSEKYLLQSITAKFPVTITGLIEQNRRRLNALMSHLTALPQWIRRFEEKIDETPARLQRAVNAIISTRSALLADMPERLRKSVDAIYAERKRALELDEQYIKMASPEYILKRGYTLVYKDGKIVKQADGVSSGDDIAVKFHDGEKKGKII